LDTFKALQLKHIKSLVERLTNDWRKGIINHISDVLQQPESSGATKAKGGAAAAASTTTSIGSSSRFNLYNNDLDSHLASDLHRLLRCVEMMMTAQLRELVFQSCAGWTDLLSRYCLPDPSLPSTVHSQGIKGIERTESWLLPLFSVELVVVGGKINFAPSVEELHKTLMSCITTMETNIRSYAGVEQETVSLIHWPSEAAPLLNVGKDAACADVDAALAQTKARIKMMLETAMEGPYALSACFEDDVSMLALNPVSYAAQFFEAKPAHEEVFQEISKFHHAAHSVGHKAFDKEVFGLVRVDATALKLRLAEKAAALRDALLETMIARMRVESEAVNEAYSAFMSRISEKPKSEAELVALKDYIRDGQATMNALAHDSKGIHARLRQMEKYSYVVSTDDFLLFWGIREWPNKVLMATQSSMHALEEERDRMIQQLDREKLAFEKELDMLEKRVEEYKLHSDLDSLVKIVDIGSNLEMELRNAKETAEDFNLREKAFEFTPTEYHLLNQIQASFDPFFRLWSIFSDFRTKREVWLTGPFMDLNSEEIERDVTEWWKTSYRMMKQLQDESPAVSEVAAQLREATDEFKKKVPLIQALASPALKSRHWSALSDKIGKDIAPDEDLTLQQLLEGGIMDHWASIEEVCTIAEKEHALDKALDSMMGDWKGMDFELHAYKETGTYVLKSVDDIMTMLDDHIVKSQTMMGSPFIKPIAEKCKSWERKLVYTQKLLDEWILVQRTWLYLEPIFSSDDIMRQMPMEHRRFVTVDSMWKKTMAEVHEDPAVMSVANKDTLLEKFSGANKLLDLIQKGLNDYLEVKRLYFARFFFLSNDELLEILSQTKDPRAVQRHLGKCFEGIAAVKFKGDTTGNKEEVLITHMVSSEGEVVEFLLKTDPDKGANKGNVEKWLLEMQNFMRVTIKDVVIRSMEAYPKVRRDKWVLDWPAQIVLNVSQMFWTQEVETAMKTKGHKGVVEYEKLLNQQLLDIVKLVRGGLTKMERTTLGALCVIDVHARDVVTQLVEKKAERASDFEWMSQLRYYWEHMPDDYNRYGENPFNLVARIINAQQMYGYEYLGNSTRLVITPLTDRCYRTLMGAVSLMYGGAPAGPAGTGKTETVKDLSKAVAILCVVFNCSDGLDYLAMAKFFKGLSASGAWACFDEFNRIELEVLSVIAQQILTIQKAKRGRVAKFVFDGTTLMLNPDCNVFITMNPGYAGRQELPDNLKALFRPCAMMVPDYAMIAEIKLYSFGFSDARNLARKLTLVLVLCSEQLSSQKHYDYGMRAVFSILVRAGNLRQSLGDKWTEDLIVLSSIIDVNLPKFTTNDLPLFKGITQDLFPGVTLPKPDYRKLLRSIKNACRANNLQAKESFVRGTTQLFETVQVRHGLMLVGRTMSGKTAVLRTLAEAMTNIKDDPDFVPVHIHTMNPKSITQGQLYGNFDENTHEWTDGVLPVVYRNCASDSVERHWIVFDGPVDAVWIENMNTVLDDNKKLCLMSGEIIKMSAGMTMMFEPEDLDEASPATVSRCGMIYLEPRRLGWRPIVVSWMKNIPARVLNAPNRFPNGTLLSSLFEWLVPPCLYFIQNHSKQLTPVTDIELVGSILNLLDCAFAGPFVKGEPEVKDADLVKTLESMFVFATIWSIGTVADAAGRVKFDAFLRHLLKGDAASDPLFQDFLVKNPTYDAHFEGAGVVAILAAGDDFTHAYDSEDEDGGGKEAELKPVEQGTQRKALTPIPEEGLVFDYLVNVARGGWITWQSIMPRYSIPPGAQFQAILVPTIDTVRNAWLIDQLIVNGKHTLCVGDTGTGKSVTLLNKLQKELNKEVFVPIMLSFSAQTSANQTQDIIDGRLTRLRKGVFGPPLGQKAVVFVDDLNMPAKEKYGAQPPIEILRQYMDHGGWYDRHDKEQSFMNLINIQFVAAMGPPGGGRSKITQRYVRHFNVVGFVPFDKDSLTRIFSTIVQWCLDAFPTAIKSLGSAVVAATIDMYDTIAVDLLPTPTKSHYTFNLRDLSKVFLGISMASPEAVEDDKAFVRLWAHECSRVFYDRLINDADRAWFWKTLSMKCRDHFRKDWAQVRGEHDVLFCNFSNPRALKKPYVEVLDRENLHKVMMLYLEDYNATAHSQMKLVLFMNAIEHVSRVSRVINQPNGNALLVGVGGSGRKSLTTLAVSIADYELYQVKISKSYSLMDWRDDIKNILRMSGQDGKSTVFLFTDTQIVQETFVEDINNLLNNGEVPNLWAPDEKAMILEDVSKAAQSAGLQLTTPNELMGYFVQRCRENLHLVLCFSPIGDAFRTRLRMFPSLVNCCTIDWFTAWPEEALRSVASSFLESEELEPSQRAGLIDVCVDMQERVASLSDAYLAQLGRYYYVTPTSYLELISTFKALLSTKRNTVLTAKKRYENGLEKLRTTADAVAVMQRELEDLQPKLKVASQETEAMLKKIAVMQISANQQKETVAGEEKICSTQAAASQALKDECEAELAMAIPALANAIKALKTLQKSDIVEVKAMKSPPDGVKVTMEAVCLMLGVPPKKIPNPAGVGPKIDDFWEPAQKQVLNDTKFLDRLMQYDKDNIAEEIMIKIRPFVTRDDFQAAVVEKASKAAGGLCKWVHAMVVYDRVAKVVAPKKAALAEATATLEAAQAALAQKQAELKTVIDQLEELQRELKLTEEKRDQLQAQVLDCSNKLDRAQRLMGGLGGERARWSEFAKELTAKMQNVVGDVTLSSGIIAYLGAFTSAFRQRCVDAWAKLLTEKGITCSEGFSLSVTLGDPVQIRAWTIAKLPNDAFSIDNAIMLYKSNRWPLMIDPQGQANKWVRNLESANSLKIVKQTQATFVRTIENAIQFGNPVLLENVGESLDPVLESVLLRQVVKIGGVNSIRLGDSTVEYDPGFRLYITTKLRNPHYSPEMCVKVNLLNFMATAEGLEDQMLGIVVRVELPDFERQREKLILEDADNKKELKRIEDDILALLAAAEGNILEDETLIDTLSKSKVKSNQIMEQVQVASKTQAKISEARAGYQPVARRASLLFFCIADLGSVDPMYQYSLEWYINLFLLAIDKAAKSRDQAERLQALNDTFTYVLYQNVCRSLFAKDKLLFSFLLCTQICLDTKVLNAAELRFFLQGSISLELARPNPTATRDRPWLSNASWSDLIDVSELPAFSGLATEVEANLKRWEAIYDAVDPAKALEDTFGERWNLFQRVVLLRCIRPDKVVPLVQQFISVQMGSKFIDPPAFDLKACFDDSVCTTPLIFVLSPGADPMTELQKVAERVGKGKQLVGVSLGQGQGPLAEKAISEAVEKGTWVCLQNCHLAESWLATLERLCEEITPESTAESFRLWLTAMPSDKFPVSILQNGVKMTLEPPKGMRANLMGSYNSLEEEWFESCVKTREFKKLVFGLCFFHATVRERSKFGPLGWNIPYEFSEPDLRISLDQLKMFLDDPNYPVVPYKALLYLVGECNYGGRVTDDKDRRCILEILSDFYTEEIQLPSYKFSPSGIYYAPAAGSLQSFKEYIRALPLIEAPEVFGMHDNADISSAMKETQLLLSTALSLQPKSAAGSGKSWDETLTTLATDISSKLPDLFDIEKVEVWYPVKFEESMNTVLTQELMRFNGLLGVVKKSLVDVRKAIKGEVVMSTELESLGNSMVKGWVPEMWSAVSYPSLKPLGSWVNDLLARLKFFQDWIDNGKPATYWISGFFFTQSFLTGTRQNFARKYVIPIDEISYDYIVFKQAQGEAISAGAPDGCYVYGLFVEGCRWDDHAGVLAESLPKELYVQMPIIHLLPRKTQDIDTKAHRYECPVYKTSERRGTLSTTGHSTNFVMMMSLPMAPAHSSKHWVKKGVALLTQLDS